MKILYRKGDALKGPEEFLAHGCNAKGVMGSGIALAIKTKYPKAYDYYKCVYDAEGLTLGVVYEYTYPEKMILNCITQPTYGKTGVHVSYDAIRTCMTRINYIVQDEDQIPHVAMPLIGAGLGGGDWQIISKIIEEVSVKYQPVVYML